MLIGIVVGNVWATRKEDSLNGLKLMVVQRLDLAHNKLAEDVYKRQSIWMPTGITNSPAYATRPF